MGGLTLLVAGGDAELTQRLERAFVYEHPRLVPDRRLAERRCRAEPRTVDRRTADRRRWKPVDEDLVARGFALINGDGGNPLGGDMPHSVPHTAMRAARVYVQDRFPHHTTLSWWNAARDGQGCIVLNAAGHPAHRVLFLADFLSTYGGALLDRMHRILDEWKIADQMLGAGPEPVTVAAYGIRRGDR